MKHVEHPHPLFEADQQLEAGRVQGHCHRLLRALVRQLAAPPLVVPEPDGAVLAAGHEHGLLEAEVHGQDLAAVEATGAHVLEVVLEL